MDVTGAIDDRVKEKVAINLSLSSLGDVMAGKVYILYTSFRISLHLIITTVRVKIIVLMKNNYLIM